jgi:hypothetical protein
MAARAAALGVPIGLVAGSAAGTIGGSAALAVGLSFAAPVVIGVAVLGGGMWAWRTYARKNKLDFALGQNHLQKVSVDAATYATEQFQKKVRLNHNSFHNRRITMLIVESHVNTWPLGVHDRWVVTLYRKWIGKCKSWVQKTEKKQEEDQKTKVRSLLAQYMPQFLSLYDF